MNRVAPYLLWIGHAGDGRNIRAIFAEGVRVVVQLAIEEPPPQLPREVTSVRVPLFDGSGNAPELVRLAIQTVALLLKEECPVLVCCSGGMSRSPAIVAAAISILEDIGVDECLARVTCSHPADVSPALWHTIRLALSAKTSRGTTLDDDVEHE